MTPRNMMLVGLFTAMIAIGSQIAVPIGPVPITLHVVAVMLAGAVLGSRLAFGSVALWALLGTVGLPVFAQGKAGAAVLIGPTGGYIFGFMLCAYLVGLAAERLALGYGKMTGVMLAGLMVIYTLGLLGFMLSFQYVLQKPMTLEKALQLAVWPFLPLDVIKTIVAAYLGVRVRRALRQAGLIHV
ncbi:MAG TPA: biotin transporter BioY [Patescibacteria group bacterium]|nr:biotin transporter BioY [Patescibacteria group bacterium]